MKVPVAFFFSLFVLICNAQKIDWSEQCNGDTIVIDPSRKFGLRMKPFPAVTCHKIGSLGLRMDLGGSYFAYNTASANWLGNHGGMSWGLIIPIRNWNIGARAKVWTIEPNTDIVTNGDTIPHSIKINPNKFEYFISYSFNFKQLSIEPFIGYSKSNYYLHQDENTYKTYSIPKIRGIVLGAGFNKYFQGKENIFTLVFMNLGYTLVDYSAVNPNLGFGHFEATIGIGFKAFYKQNYYKRVELPILHQL